MNFLSSPSLLIYKLMMAAFCYYFKVLIQPPFYFYTHLRCRIEYISSTQSAKSIEVIDRENIITSRSMALTKESSSIYKPRVIFIRNTIKDFKSIIFMTEHYLFSFKNILYTL